MKTVSPASVIAVLALLSSPSMAADSFDLSIRPLLREFCLSCHSTELQEGELDLERFDSTEQVARHADVWERVAEQLALGEMPPKDSRQLSADQQQLLIGWVRKTLNEVALANAGDPGPVVLRRLSNHEYTYSIRDLTGVPSLDPAREFPVDGAAGEGFTNVGAALVMSPALLSKYLEAAKGVSRHLVLLEDGVRFSASDSSQDWAGEALANLRNFYARHTAPSELVNEVAGTGQIASEAGMIPLARYLDALQGRGSRAGLSPKYLALLEESLRAPGTSLLLDPLREKFHDGQLNAHDIETWQNVLWRFHPVGHLGRPNGPKSWQEPKNPFVIQQEFRVPLEAGQNARLYLVAGTAGDGNDGDQVVWENPQLIAPGHPDVPLASVPDLLQHLESQRAQLLADAEICLAALAAGNEDAPQESLAAWREYLGFGASKLEPLLNTPVDGTPEYGFLKAWRDEREPDLAVWANSSDAVVRFPGIMPAHSVATHPVPERESVIAWKSPVASTRLQITGRVEHAHAECGNGITWVLEIRRGNRTETLASGVLDRAQGTLLGPWENVPIGVDQAVALVIGPRDNNHFCDLTAIQLALSDGEHTWDLARDVSPDLLAGNPHGPWHFLSQPVTANRTEELPAALVDWRKSPSPELAARVRADLEQNCPLSHPLLKPARKAFRPVTLNPAMTVQAPAVLEIEIPAALTSGAEFVVSGRLATADEGSVQLQVLKGQPTAPLEALQSHLPIVVGDDSPARRRWETACDEFRAIFPAALCYSRIVPIDEAVTLHLYHREDEPLRRLMLSDAEAQQLDRLWGELLFVSEAPLKQVDVFEQIYQFATQDRPDLVVEFENMREPILRKADEFLARQQQAEAAQRQAVIQLASRAWRRPLTETEIASLSHMPPRLMLTRVLTSPAFLYRSESPSSQTGPVNDWELATRLSYFLWSSLPDEELRAEAAAGRLRDPDVLAAQSLRMLRDDRVRRLATEFGCQSLHVRDVATLDEKSERHFPTFKPLRTAMQEEVTRFYTDLFQNDRSVLALLDADYTFLNEPLAAHYGIPFEGTGWQRVDGIQKHGRGGVLGFSATLATNSGASRTSAILRGAWVSEVLLGEKIPNPPQDVPTLPEEAPEGLSERQLIELHSRDARCAGCHKRIDPFGFALEGFDAIGRARPADTATVVFDGTELEGLDGLRNYLVYQRRADFLRQFSRKLLGYALGRSVQLSDQPLIDNLAETEDGQIGALIEKIVRSPQFREIRGQPSP